MQAATLLQLIFPLRLYLYKSSTYQRSFQHITKPHRIPKRCGTTKSRSLEKRTGAVYF